MLRFVITTGLLSVLSWIFRSSIVSRFILLLTFICAGGGWLWQIYAPLDWLSIDAVSYLSVCFLLLLAPLLFLKDDVHDPDVGINDEKLFWICDIVILLMLVPTIFFLSNLSNGFASDISDLRNDVVHQVNVQVQRTPIERLLVFPAYAFVIPMGLFVYTFLFKMATVGKRRLILLLFCSMISPLMGLGSWSRNVLIVWIVHFGVFFLLMAPYAKINVTTIRLIVMSIGLPILLVITISVSRFDSLDWMWEYCFGGPVLFSWVYLEEMNLEKFQYGEMFIPLLTKIMSVFSSNVLFHPSLQNQFHELNGDLAVQYNYYSGCFTSIVGIVLKSFSKFITLVIFGLMGGGAFFFFRQKGRSLLPFSYILVPFLCSQAFATIGFVYAGIGGNITMLICFAFACLLFKIEDNGET